MVLLCPYSGCHCARHIEPVLTRSLEYLSPQINTAMDQTLRLQLSDFLIRPPKKYSPNLVAGIFPNVKSKSALDDLLHSGYFHSVAWRFFHADATNNHLHLILLISYYELEFTNLSSCFELMAKDSARFQDLILRVLQVTMNVSDSNIILKGSAFLFLSAVVRFNTSDLEKNKFYPKWNETVLKLYLRTYSSTEVPGFNKCLLYFCICCAVSLEEMKSRLRALHVSLYFTYLEEERGEALIKRLGDLLSLILNEPIEFVTAQLVFKEAALGPDYDFFTMAFSRLDVTHTELSKALELLDSSQLTQLAQSLHLKGEEIPDRILNEAITQRVLGPRIAYSRVFNISQFTECDLFDIVDEQQYPELAVNPIIPYPSIMTSQILRSGEQARLSVKILHQINEHLITSLGRLTITDGTKNEGIKGKSKYFFRLESIERVGSFSTLIVKGDVNVNSGSILVLLEVHKPIGHDERLRIKKFGIQSARIVTIASPAIGNRIRVHGNIHGFENRLNAFITLPDSINVGSLNTMNRLSSECNNVHPIFEKQEHLKTCGQEVEVPRLNVEVLNEIEGVELGKRRKSDDGAFQYFKNNDTTFVSKCAKSDLNVEESNALLHILSSNFLVVTGNTNSGQEKITNYFLETLSLNWSRERCLIVMPTRSSILLFTLANNLNLSCVKIGDQKNLTDILERRSQLLETVSKMSENLGLNDYAFDTNAVNSLMLYESHIVHKWNAYLKQLLKAKASIQRYPFKIFEFAENEVNIELMLTAIVDHYTSIKRTFFELQQMLPLDKVDLKKDTDTIEKYFVKKSKYVFASIADLTHIDDKFENIICFSSEPETLIPILQSGNYMKRVIFFSQMHFSGITKLADPTSTELPLVGVRREIAALTGGSCQVKSKYNPGFKYVAQHIRVPASQSQVNVDEARYVVFLFQYFRLLGYPHHKVLIAIASPYMKILIEEVLQEHKIGKEDVPSDLVAGFKFGWPHMQSTSEPSPSEYMIVSSHPGLSMREYKNIARNAQLGFYIVGSNCTAPYKLKVADFELYTGAQYMTGKDSRSSTEAHQMEGADHMGEYIDQMTRTRMGKA